MEHPKIYSSVIWFKVIASSTAQIPLVHVCPWWSPQACMSLVGSISKGMVFDDRLRWDSLVSTVCGKVTFYLYIAIAIGSMHIVT